jgi:uncharacterized protein YprB with RNaseH-like and TPR domain
VVGLYDGRKYELFVDGENLPDLPKRLQQYPVVITFNGAGFDLRFLKVAFPDLRLPPIHIDLRWVTRKLGIGHSVEHRRETCRLNIEVNTVPSKIGKYSPRFPKNR